MGRIRGSSKVGAKCKRHPVGRSLMTKVFASLCSFVPRNPVHLDGSRPLDLRLSVQTAKPIDRKSFRVGNYVFS